MDEQEFKERTIRLGLNVIALSRSITRDIASDVLVRQVIRSATSVGSNYHAACRARSDSEMLAKLAIVEEEADETMFWLQMLMRAGAAPDSKVKPLEAEAEEILRMTVASIRTIRARIKRGDARTQVPSRRSPVAPRPIRNPEIRDPK